MNKVSILRRHCITTNNSMKEESVKFNNFLDILPNFILFRPFEDNIPEQISIKDIDNSDFIKSLSYSSGFNIELFKSNSNREKSKHKKMVNISMNNEYSPYWTQDSTTLKIDWDNETIDFFIEEEDELYNISQRSQGKQWHLSFYLKTAVQNKSKANVFLIDEPGLFLHASAQRDIYNRLIATSHGQHVQVLFTTHSPYLMKYDEIYRIRLVQKPDILLGTQIFNKVHAKADKETLTPILTAIGLEINQGIHAIDKLNNVVVEGPSDVLYFRAFSILYKEENINFIYGGGSGNMGYMGAILSGWGCNTVYLYDNDQGQRDGAKNIKKTWLISSDKILSVTDLIGGSIEDVFSKDDFKVYILNDTSAHIETTNSEYIKKESRANKVIMAKYFLEKVDSGNIILSNETKDAITNLYDMIRMALARTN